MDNDPDEKHSIAANAQTTDAAIAHHDLKHALDDLNYVKPPAKSDP
jgi:hypothetical protein